MSEFDRQLEMLVGAPKPLVFAFGWPEPVAASRESVRALIFAGEVAKDFDGLILRADGRFLECVKLGKVWRLSSGAFSGPRSINDAQIVSVDESGRPIPPKIGILRLLPGNNGRQCNWQEALGVALDFLGLDQLPPRLTWWFKDRI